MTFTDEALERLKNSPKPRRSVAPQIVDAIIARMEAAERFKDCWLHARQFSHAKEGEVCNLCDEFQRVDETWRKACGVK